MADAQTIHPHLSGVLAPVRSEDDFEMRVVGRIPDALAGAYYRNGPNPQFDPQGMYYGFLGDGMIHGFFLDPNKDGVPRPLSKPVGSHAEMAGREQGRTSAIRLLGCPERSFRRQRACGHSEH